MYSVGASIVKPLEDLYKDFGRDVDQSYSKVWSAPAEWVCQEYDALVKSRVCSVDCSSTHGLDWYEVILPSQKERRSMYDMLTGWKYKTGEMAWTYDLDHNPTKRPRILCEKEVC